MVGMMNVNIEFIEICCVQDIRDLIIEINKKLMNIISRICLIFSTKLNVTKVQIKKSLIIAPLFPLFIYYFLSASAVAISLIIELRSFGLEPFGIFLMFIPFVAGAIIFYFIFCYIFIYLLQLFLIKYFYINLYTILLSSLILTIILNILFYLVNLPINDTGILYLFSIPTALSYWILLFKEHKKT